MCVFILGLFFPIEERVMSEFKCLAVCSAGAVQHLGLSTFYIVAGEEAAGPFPCRLV